VVKEPEPEVIAESAPASEPERESEEDLYPETVAEEPVLSGEPIAPEQGQAVTPPQPPPPEPPPSTGSPWPAIVAFAVLLVALAIGAGIVAKSHAHHRRLAIALASPAPTVYLTPPPVPRPAPTQQARLPIHQRSAIAKAPPPMPVMTPTPAPAKTATPPPLITSTPAPAKTATPAPTVASTVKIDSFTVMRSLRRRVCLGFRVENATNVSITNARTQEVVYARDLSGKGVAENQPPCVFVKRGGVRGAIGFELVASGQNSQTTKYLSAPPFLTP
jgi:hypothetical protein